MLDIKDFYVLDICENKEIFFLIKYVINVNGEINKFYGKKKKSSFKILV